MIGDLVTTDDLRRFVRTIGGMSPAADDAERIDRVRLLEELKAVAAAAQVRESVCFAASQRESQAAAGVRAEHLERGVAAQLGLAMRTSPFRAQRFLGFARILCAELPATYAELAAGRTTQWRATLVARETAMLSREGRALVDAELAPRLEGLGDRRVEAEARTAAYRLDPRAATERARRAAADRRVSIRPAPDTMCWLSALLPVAQGVAAYAALTRAADTGINAGDSRSRGQIMADTLVERVTGQRAADDVPVEVNIVMTDQSLLERDDEPAVVPGYGPIPAGVARDLAFGKSADDAPRWLQRIYRRPGDRSLVTMESRRRTFSPAQRKFLRLRDQNCRTPWCDAPIRHADHVTPHIDGGATSIQNGQGYCEACNHAKQAPNWHAERLRDTITIVTPTGHTYASRPPDPPGTARAA